MYISQNLTMMMKNTLSNFIVLLISSVILGIMPLHSAEVKILTDSEEKLVLQVNLSGPLEWRLANDTRQVPDYLIIEDAELRAITENLLVPFFQWRIALPAVQKPKISLRILSSEVQHLPRPLTTEEVTILGKLPMVEISDLGYMATNPTALLTFFPLQIGQSSDQIIILRSVEISVDFTTIPVPKSGHIPDKMPLNAAFLNSHTALRWCQSPTPKFRKTVEYPSGQWFRLSINQDAIYAITLADLRNAGLTLSQIDTNRLILFTNSSGGRALSDDLPTDTLPALIEVSRELRGNGDAYFASGDTLVFWGRGSSGIAASPDGKLVYERNLFANTNYYWLLISDTPAKPKTMSALLSLDDSPSKISTTTDVLERHEVEAVNFLHSGRNWYGEKFNGSGSSVSVLFDLPFSQNNYSTEIKIRTKGATESASYSFNLYIKDMTTPVTSWSTQYYYSIIKTITTTLTPGANILRINYTASPSSATAYLDYIECRYQADLKSTSKPLLFWAPVTTGLVEYQVEISTRSNYLLYDITDWQNVAKQQFVINGNYLTFRAPNEILKRRRYYLLTPTDFQKPAKIERFENISFNSLREQTSGADYVIITDDKLVAAAEDLARLHSQDVPISDRLQTIVVTQSQIIREFHGDVLDPNAIRNFLQYAYNNWSLAPRFVLLFGDGTYDYRGIESSSGNLVMTYQVEPASESNDGLSSYAADCRYTYVNGNDKIMDLAIGRITVRTVQEAQGVVAKIRKYVLEPEYGDWRSQVTLVADDPQRPLDNEQYHISDTENYIARYVSKNLTINKIYLLEYPEVQDASTYGVKKPAANEAILKQLAKGTTIINYLGHGSPTVWAQEYVLVKDRDLGKINTGMKLPLWIAATCSWGQFDDISLACMPEALLLDNYNGAIAAIAATRPTYPTPNRAFISAILQKWFTGRKINRYRIGQIIQMVLNGSNENNEKYMLFGDPALFLALPYTETSFDRLPTDTLYTLQNVTVSGKVKDQQSNFAGQGILKVFDSDRYVTRQYQDDSKTTQQMSYVLPGRIIFNGKILLENNHFQSQFFVPKDINYEKRYGRFNIYGWNPETKVEIGGYYDSLSYLGSVVLIDTTGPKITLGFKDIDFRNGDIITPERQLEIKISDPHGINIAGQLGHEITVQFDQDEDFILTVTDEFAYDINSDTSGMIILSLPQLEEGKHYVTVKAWDNANNFTQQSLEFTLTNYEKLQLQRVVNFPNPFRKETDFTFYLTQPSQVKITVYTLRGLKIVTLDSNTVLPAGFNFLHWNGKDEFGDDIANGIYLYKIQVVSPDKKQKDQFIGKIVKAK